MKLSKETLKQIINEELQKVMNENMSSSDLVRKIEELVFSGREGYNQAESLADYAIPMMDQQDAEYIESIFKAGRATDKRKSLSREIMDSVKDGSYSEETFMDDFGHRVKENDDQYFGALDKIEDIKDEYIRRKLHRMFRSF